MAGTDRGLDFARRRRRGARRHRHADGQGHVVDAAGNAGRQVPRRGGRLDGRVLVRGAGRRGRGRRGHRRGAASSASGSRTTAASRSTRSPSRARCRAPCGWAWARRCRRRRSTTKGCRCAPTCSTTAIPTIVESPPIEVKLVESHRSARAVRREGGERGRAAQLRAGAHQRDLRRHRHPPDRAAGLARPRARGDPGAQAQGAPAGQRRRARARRAGGRADDGTHARVRTSSARRASPRPPRCSPPTPGARLLAGGTDLLPNLRRGIERPAVLVDLGAVHGFADIDRRPTTACRSAPA